MSKHPTIGFSQFSSPEKGVAIVLVGEGGTFAERPGAAVGDASLVSRLIEVTGFKGKLGASVETMVPEGTGIDRLVLVGVGDPAKLESDDWLKLGGAAFAKIGQGKTASAVLALPEAVVSPKNAADFALGMLLRAYRFDKYKTKKTDDNDTEPKGNVTITLQTSDHAAAKEAFAGVEAVAGGVRLARDLVNEPANILGPVEFAEKVVKLEKLGVKVEILTEKDLKKLGMGALLGVAQGSVRPPRIAIMEWNGGKEKESPVAFIGKGVVFDTGGISIKQASGMEDMKGDMGGAAAVTGLIHALAARKAKVNAIGIIGLVENMPDGNAQRPGDIVTSMSGQTIEVLNTDAEGRLVLADVLWYANDRFKPRFMVDLATLTGAIMVALGLHRAGLFSNDDTLAAQLHAAGEATGEKLWRMPLGTEYDKLIDSKNADMKNIGGRNGGSITAAQFLKRFVGDTPWAHLDIAGTAIGAPTNEYSQSWASGFGVRLLDQLVRDNFEG